LIKSRNNELIKRKFPQRKKPIFRWFLLWILPKDNAQININSSNSSKIYQSQIIPNLFYRACITILIKHLRKRKILINIFYGYRCKNLPRSTKKLNLIICTKDYIPWLHRIHFMHAKLIQHSRINQSDIPYQ
jgi:hypothetical protein